MQIPSWMNKVFFNDVVKHHFSDGSANVIDFTIKPALHPTENVVSSIFRVAIKFSTVTLSKNFLSVVIKIPPTANNQADFVENVVNSIYKNELDMYKEEGPLNKMKNLLESAGDFCQIQPKLIYQSMQPHFVIVLDDLGALGYEKIKQPLENFEETKQVFQRLAKFHAASYFLINERDEDFRSFEFSMFGIEDSFLLEKFFYEPLDTFTEVLESWGGYDDCIEKLKVFRENFIGKGKELYKPNKNGYNVLNHGDFHIKNLLFKKKGEKIEDFYIMDFQVCVLASPCVDLFYALYNMISDENRQTRRDEIIQYYHSEFTSAVKSSGPTQKEIPSLLDLEMELKKHGWMEVLKCICFKLFFWMDASDLMGTGDTKQMKRKIFEDEKFKTFIKMELPRLLELGFL